MGKESTGANAKAGQLLPDKEFKEAIATTPIATTPTEIMENQRLWRER